MCRSIDQAGNRKNIRCVSCENPKKRRARQNLSYHLNKAKSATQAKSPDLSVLERDTNTISGFDNQQPIASEIIENRVSIVAEYREKAKNMTFSEWIEPHGQYNTVEEMLALREQEISAIGAVVSARAQQLAGMTYEEGQKALKDAEKQTDVTYDKIRELGKERRKLEEVPAQERNEEFHQQLDDLMEQQFRANDEFNEASKKFLVEEERINSLFAESHLKALSEVRQVGGTANVIGSTKFIGTSFQQAINKNIPSDWIRASNEANKHIYVSSSTSRGRYNSAEMKQVGFKVEPMKAYPQNGHYFSTEDQKPHPEDCRYQDWEQDDTELWSGTAMEIADESTPSKTLSNGEVVPKGHGWKKGKIYTRVETGEMGLKEVYYKPYTKKSKHYEALPAIEVGVKVKSGKLEDPEKFEQTSTHEFLHHMETLNPKMVAVQNAFYQRRTTNPDGSKMPLVSYGTADDELVREDNFVSVYMGKDYGKDVVHKEIMTTGTEAVLSGRYGGLIGISRTNTRKDTDMLNFVLGSLSTL